MTTNTSPPLNSLSSTPSSGLRLPSIPSADAQPSFNTADDNEFSTRSPRDQDNDYESSSSGDDNHHNYRDDVEDDVDDDDYDGGNRWAEYAQSGATASGLGGGMGIGDIRSNVQMAALKEVNQSDLSIPVQDGILQRRIRTKDMQLFSLSALSVLLMILDLEIYFKTVNTSTPYSYQWIVRAAISGSTVISLILLYVYYQLEVARDRLRNPLFADSSLWNSKRHLFPFLIEFGIIAIHIPPGVDILPSLNLVIFFRLYNAMRVFRDFSFLSGQAGKFAGAFSNVQMNASFVLRTFLYKHPFQTVLGLLSIVSLVMGYVIHVLERDANSQFYDLASTLYFLFITMTTVGYGDLQPITPGGRVFTIVTAILGGIFSAMMIAIVHSRLHLTRHQQGVVAFLDSRQLHNSIQDAAVLAIQARWRTHRVRGKLLAAKDELAVLLRPLAEALPAEARSPPADPEAGADQDTLGNVSGDRRASNMSAGSDNSGGTLGKTPSMETLYSKDTVKAIIAGMEPEEKAKYLNAARNVSHLRKKYITFKRRHLTRLEEFRKVRREGQSFLSSIRSNHGSGPISMERLFDEVQTLAFAIDELYGMVLQNSSSAQHAPPPPEPLPPSPSGQGWRSTTHLKASASTAALSVPSPRSLNQSHSISDLSEGSAVPPHLKPSPSQSSLHQRRSSLLPSAAAAAAVGLGNAVHTESSHSVNQQQPGQLQHAHQHQHQQGQQAQQAQQAQQHQQPQRTTGLVMQRLQLNEDVKSKLSTLQFRMGKMEDSLGDIMKLLTVMRSEQLADAGNEAPPKSKMSRARSLKQLARDHPGTGSGRSERPRAKRSPRTPRVKEKPPQPSPVIVQPDPHDGAAGLDAVVDDDGGFFSGASSQTLALRNMGAKMSYRSTFAELGGKVASPTAKGPKRRG